MVSETLASENPGMKLFFDVVGPTDRSFDFRGAMFRCAEQAQRTAEMLSLDLAFAENSPWIGARVEVLDEIGNCLFQIPVRELH
jgi:hypothetical protein